MITLARCFHPCGRGSMSENPCTQKSSALPHGVPLHPIFLYKLVQLSLVRLNMVPQFGFAEQKTGRCAEWHAAPHHWFFPSHPNYAFADSGRHHQSCDDKLHSTPPIRFHLRPAGPLTTQLPWLFGMSRSRAVAWPAQKFFGVAKGVILGK